MKNLPKFLDIEIKPQYEAFCDRGSEENCVGHFAIWQYAYDTGLNITHIKVKMDGTVRFNFAGRRYVLPPDEIWRTMAENYDRTGHVEQLRLRLDMSGATVTEIRPAARVVSAAQAQRSDVKAPRRTSEWVLNRSRRTYRPKRASDESVVSPRSVYTGTVHKLRAEHPGFAPAHPQAPSERKQRFDEMRKSGTATG